MGLEGKLVTRQWEDKEGKKQYTTEVVCNQVLLLGGKA
ncbi:single-stranded DNA-binding protein [Nonlabens sp.]